MLGVRTQSIIQLRLTGCSKATINTAIPFHAAIASWYVFDYLVHLQLQKLLPFWSDLFVFHYLVHLQLQSHTHSQQSQTSISITILHHSIGTVTIQPFPL